MELTLLDVLEERMARGLIEVKSEEGRDFVWRKCGALGEAECLKWLQKALPDVPSIFHDVAIDYHGSTQIDLLVLTDDCWWVVEVKNYSRPFEYINHSGELSGHSMRSDQMAVMRNRMRIVRELAASIDARIQVEGTMVFIHPESEVRIESQEDFYIVTRNQFNRHIEMMRSKHRLYRNSRARDYFDKIMKYHSPYPVVLPLMTDADWVRARKGCRCENCGSYHLESSKKMMTCLDCGQLMTKTQLAQSLYCQLCVLEHDKEMGVTTSQLLKLCDGQLSKTTVNRVLTQDIEIRNKYKYSYFHNHRLPRNKMDHIFGPRKHSHRKK